MPPYWQKPLLLDVNTQGVKAEFSGPPFSDLLAPHVGAAGRCGRDRLGGGRGNSLRDRHVDSLGDVLRICYVNMGLIGVGVILVTILSLPLPSRETE